MTHAERIFILLCWGLFAFAGCTMMTLPPVTKYPSVAFAQGQVDRQWQAQETQRQQQRTAARQASVARQQQFALAVALPQPLVRVKTNCPNCPPHIIPCTNVHVTVFANPTKLQFVRVQQTHDLVNWQEVTNSGNTTYFDAMTFTFTNDGTAGLTAYRAMYDN